MSIIWRNSDIFKLKELNYRASYACIPYNNIHVLQSKRNAALKSKLKNTSGVYSTIWDK